ncbi:meiosis-specific with OB domain-containing protein-like [Trichogramma pretiosum]|uniref:meiosis-specific with OB domain-containing protein-like n=1 Tax=Trichogramma pretiosum TaxID=7493 RepID=UPI000C71C8FF|nr:meiosis-specific with OB domain-containing protein-like [Trichogramma pretiosum]
MANVSRQPICSLQPQMQNTVIVGVIIRSQNSKVTKFSDNNGSRAVWNFTLRDSVNDFINATVWGAVDFINKLFTTYGIGSVVEVINAKITDRKPDDPNEVYVPSVTSQFTLTLNQSSSLMQLHSSPATPRYASLVRVPTKNPAGALNLAYVLENAESLKNQYVDVIVVVTFVSQTREIVTRLGELSKIREFEVSDPSTNHSLPLTLWDLEWIKLADKWEPKHTVLFLADAQVTYSDKVRKSTLTIVRKTVITENPDISETKQMRDVFLTKPDIGSTSPYAVPNPNSITKQMTIREITNRLNLAASIASDERLQLLVVVTAMVDDMNLDSNDLTLLSARCAKCKRMVASGNESCMNLECPFGNGLKAPMNVVSLNILITLKDDTGYLVGCRLRDTAAEQVIGCTAEAIGGMTREQRIKLKEKYYKKLCIVRMQIIGPSANIQKSIYNILALNRLRDDLRSQMNIHRKKNRQNVINRKRPYLGEVIQNTVFSEQDVSRMALNLRKKPLDGNEYRDLQNALIQSENNINSYFSVGQSYEGLVRDLSGRNGTHKLFAANCLCNLSLGNSKACFTLSKFSAPYLILELASSNIKIAETCAWTIGNIVSQSDKALAIFKKQNCLQTLIKILDECQSELLPALHYAILRYVHADFNNISEEDLRKIADHVAKKYSEDSEIDTIWLIAILSSYSACHEPLKYCISQIFSKLYSLSQSKDVHLSEVSAYLRTLANVICETTGKVAHLVFGSCESEHEKNQLLFEALLKYPYDCVRQETIWLLGNLFNHPVDTVKQIVSLNALSLTSLTLAKNACSDVA